MAEGGELPTIDISLINLNTPQNSPQKTTRPIAIVSPNGMKVMRWTKDGFHGFYSEYATDESLSIVSNYIRIMNIMDPSQQIYFNHTLGGIETKPLTLQPMIRKCDDSPDCANIIWFTKKEQLRSLEQIPFFVLHRIIPRILNGTYDEELDRNEGDEN